MKRILFSITVVIFLATVIFSCTRSDFDVAENGTKFKVHHRGDDTTKATEGEVVTIKLSYRLGDSVIFNSDYTEEGNMKFPIIKPLFKGDLYDGLVLMGAGDSMTIEVVADSFYLKTAALKELPEFVVPGSSLYYDIKLLRHINSAQWQAEQSDISKENQRLEKIQLQNYLVDNNIAIKPTPSGLYFIPIAEGRGAHPDTGDMCQLYISVKQLGNDELLYDNFNDRPIDVEFGHEFDTEGFREGLGMLKPGGRAQLLVPSWIGVASTGNEVVPQNTTIVYEVELIAIRNLDEVNKDRERYKKEQEEEKIRLKEDEPERISNYISKNSITVVPTESGLYFKELVAGEGNFPVDGNTVTIQYIHYDLDGNVIQSSYVDNTPFTYQVGTGAVIVGWEEAVKLMRKGGKAWMLLPSSIGYGDYQRTRDIKPYSPLVFELELVDVKK